MSKFVKCSFQILPDEEITWIERTTRISSAFDIWIATLASIIYSSLAITCFLFCENSLPKWIVSLALKQFSRALEKINVAPFDCLSYNKSPVENITANTGNRSFYRLWKIYFRFVFEVTSVETIASAFIFDKTNLTAAFKNIVTDKVVHTKNICQENRDQIIIHRVRNNDGRNHFCVCTNLNGP